MTLETRLPNMFAMSTDEHRYHHDNPKDFIARLVKITILVDNRAFRVACEQIPVDADAPHWTWDIPSRAH